MNEADFTPAHRRWINRLKRLCADVPDDLRLYVIDGNSIIVCRAGVPSVELSATADVHISPCCVLTDVHDDLDNGLG